MRGRLLDACGHRGAACSHAGVLNRSGFALENILARICREARGRVRTNVMFRDMDPPKPDVQDGRRSWWTDSHCGEVLNWQATRRWCVRGTETAGHVGELNAMGLH